MCHQPLVQAPGFKILLISSVMSDIHIHHIYHLSARYEQKAHHIDHRLLLPASLHISAGSQDSGEVVLDLVLEPPVRINDDPVASFIVLD